MSTTLNKKDIIDLLPHREPMLLIDELRDIKKLHSDYSSAINDSSALRSSVGIGVDWYTPIGPMSFSLAQPISKKSSDKTESFRFNLGTTF